MTKDTTPPKEKRQRPVPTSRMMADAQKLLKENDARLDAILKKAGYGPGQTPEPEDKRPRRKSSIVSDLVTTGVPPVTKHDAKPKEAQSEGVELMREKVAALVKIVNSSDDLSEVHRAVAGMIEMMEQEKKTPLYTVKLSEATVKELKAQDDYYDPKTKEAMTLLKSLTEAAHTRRWAEIHKELSIYHPELGLRYGSNEMKCDLKKGEITIYQEQ